MENKSCNAELLQIDSTNENPARVLLNWARKSYAYENIPPAIDKFNYEYSKYKKEKNQEVDQAIQFMRSLAFEKVSELESEVQLRMRKLENRSFWHFISQPVTSLAAKVKHLDLLSNKNLVHSSSAYPIETEYSMENSGDMVVINKIQPRDVQRGAQELGLSKNQNIYEHYVTNCGHVPKLIKILRSSYCKLHFLIKDFTIVMKNADKLDRLVFGSFGLSLYSQELWQLCEYWSTCPNTSDENSFAYQDFRRVVDTVTKDHCKENLYDMNKNIDIVKKLKTLAQFLNDDFYKMVAIWYACEIFDRVPLDYVSFHEKLYLQWMKDCCEVLNYVIVNEFHPGVYSLDIKRGIDRLHGILVQINLFAHD